MTKAAGSSRRVARMARRMIPACKRWARRCEKLGSLFPRLQIRSNNTTGVSTLDSAFADPDMEALRQKVNEMILNGRR